MDFSKFSDKDFEVKKWVNEALKAQKDSKTPLDGQASMLVMKLQLFIQEVSNSLEDSSQQVVQSLPRVLRDIEAVKQEAVLLREQMRVVKEDIKQVEKDTSNSMQRLVELDRIKTRMKESQNALQEADNWTTLSADVEEVFASQDIEQISEKVTGMHQSLNVLHDVPDYKDRHTLLESLKNRLEALLVPLLMEAFNNHLTDEANFYYEVFSNIAREARVKEYYIQCHKNYVQQLWTNLLKQNVEVIDLLSRFYEALLTKWTSELSWSSHVFPSPLEMLVSLFRTSLSSLTPPPGQYLHTHVNKSHSPIHTLTTSRNVMKHFLHNLQQSFKNTKDIGCHGDALYSLVECFHVPYCQLLVQYGSQQQQVLLKELTTVALDDGSPEDILQSVSFSIPKLIGFVSRSLESCVCLTDGWGVNALVKSIEAVLVQYLKKLQVSLSRLRLACGMNGDVSGRHETTDKDQWINLKWAFQFVRHCGDLFLQMTSLNSQICTLIRGCGPSYTSPAGSENPFGTFDYLRTFYPEEHTLVMELYSCIEKGGVNGDDVLMLNKTCAELKLLTSNGHSLAFDILFVELKDKLLGVPRLKVWERGVVSPVDSPRALTNDLPTFSRSPLPYITEIGDYLLTLPQQIEPFTSVEDPAFSAAMTNTQLPYTNEKGSVSDEDSAVDHPTDAWLSAVAHGTMETYVKSILEIPKLNDEASQQLATDIGYLCNVLAALDQQPISSLTALEKMLKAPDRQMFEVYKSSKDVGSDLFKAVAAQRTFS